MEQKNVMYMSEHSLPPNTQLLSRLYLKPENSDVLQMVSKKNTMPKRAVIANEDSNAPVSNPFVTFVPRPPPGNTDRMYLPIRTSINTEDWKKRGAGRLKEEMRHKNNVIRDIHPRELKSKVGMKGMTDTADHSLQPAELDMKCPKHSDDDFSYGTKEGYVLAKVPPPLQTPATGQDTAPVTAKLMKELLAELQKNLQADMATIRQDLKGLTGRIGALETTSPSCKQQLTTLQQEVKDLQILTCSYECRFAALEDSRRQNNVKVRGVPDNIPDAELPHVVRRLLSALLTPKLSRALETESIFRVPKSAQAPTSATRDLIIQFVRGKDKAAFLNTLRGNSPYAFEEPDDSVITLIIRMRDKLGWKTELHNKIVEHRTMTDKYTGLLEAKKPVLEDRGDFVYCLPRDSISPTARYNVYDLQVVPAARALRSEMYWTVSASQVCKICMVSGAEIMDIVPLTEWLHERANYYVIKDLTIFSQFRLRKAFAVWKMNVRRAKTDHSRTMMLKQLYFADELFLGCLLYIQSVREDAVTVDLGGVCGETAIVLIKLSDSHTYSLKEFCAVQSQQGDTALAKIETLRKKVVAVISQTCLKVAEVEGMGHLFSSENPIKPNYTELSNCRNLQERFGRFLNLTDTIFQEILRCVVINSVRLLLEFLQTSYDVTSTDVKKNKELSLEEETKSGKSVQTMKEEKLVTVKAEQKQVLFESDIVKALYDIKKKFEGKHEAAPVFEVNLALCCHPGREHSSRIGEMPVSPSTAGPGKPERQAGPRQRVPTMDGKMETLSSADGKQVTFQDSSLSDAEESDEDSDDEIAPESIFLKVGTMGRKLKKQRADKPRLGMNIGELWRQAHEATDAKMASLHGGCTDFSDENSDDTSEVLIPASALPPPIRAQTQPVGTNPNPVTMEALSTLISEHHGKIAADVALIRGDLKLIATRLGTVEETTTKHTCQIKELQTAVHNLQQQTLQHEYQLSTMEDKRRQTHLKVRGIADTVPEAELPHLIRRLLTALLNPKTAKAILIDGIFRVPRPANAPPNTTRDVVIRFQTLKDKAAVLEATRGHTTYSFEDMNLSFYTDLSSGTLAWRRSLRQFTAELRQHQIKYRWSSATSNNLVCVSPAKTEFEEHVEGIVNGFEQIIGKIDALSQETSLSNFCFQITRNIPVSPMEPEQNARERLQVWPDCELLLGTDPDYQSKVQNIISIVKNSMKDVESYSRDFNKYCTMVGTAQNVKMKITRAETEMSPDDYRNILATFKHFITECKQMNTERRVHACKVHSLQYQMECLQHLEAVLRSVCVSLPVLAYAKNLQLLDVIHDALRKLNMDLTQVEDFVEHLTFLGQISSEVPSLEKKYTTVIQLYAVAKDYNVPISSEELALFQSLTPSFQQLKSSVLYCEAKKDEGIVKFSGDLDKYISNLHFEIMDLKIKVRSPILLQSDTFPMEAKDTILNLQEEFEDISSKAQCYSTYQERFGSSITHMKAQLMDTILSQKSATGDISTHLLNTELTEVECDLSLRKLLWESTEEWANLSAEWRSTSFQQLNVDVIQRDVNRFSHTLIMLEKGLPTNDIVVSLRQSILDFKQSLPIVVALRNPCLQNRHWETIHNTIGRLIIRDKNFTLGNLLELKIAQHKNKIIDISTTATNEATLEGMLHKIIRLWNKTEFALTVHRSELSEVPIIASAEDIMTQLEECQVIISTLKGSRYAGPIKNTVAEWDRKLNLFIRTMEEWMMCQKNWLYLEQIFLASDIQRQLPAEAKLFSQVDSSWKEIMNNIKDRPNALRAATVPGLLEILQNNNVCLEKILKCLEDFLEIKRRVFPRFYFLSNDDLISILSESKNPNVVQRHLEKCFENIRHLDIEYPIKSPAVVVMITSAEGERIPMPKNVRIRGPVEQWLGNLESSMFDVVKKMLKIGVMDWNPSVFKNWMLSHPGQVVLVVSQIMFNKDCVRSFSSPDPEEELNVVYSNLVNRLGDLAEIALDISIPHQKTTLEALLTLYVHCRDILEVLIRKKVFNSEDFEWIRQLRYEWNEQNNSCYVLQGNASFMYGYEYLGCSSRLVITPLTDRCWLTLTAALHLHLGGSPAGPAGTGKTETVKDLAKALGKQCVVFNCSEGLDYKMMGKFFSGMAQSGAWCCFDEFNRIDIEVLSVIASQIHSIKTAKDSQAIRFVFEGREIRLNMSCGIFITMNPGYGGRVELPDNLKSFFRPVAMMVPDYQLIAEIMLFSEGFKAAKSLSRKLVNLYQLASKQLSQQNHYDFGMRAIKTVLVMAGQKKQKLESRHDKVKKLDVEEESLIIINALKEANLPKFLAEDVPLFENIMVDLFPGITAEKTDTKQLEKAISLAINELGLQPWESQLEKAIQFYNQIVARHGVMLVGPSGGGKTTVRRIMEKALAHMPSNSNNSSLNVSKKGKVETFILNPKCVSLGELYGEINPNTMEWSDGLLASAVRSFAEHSSKDNAKHAIVTHLENTEEGSNPPSARTNKEYEDSVTGHVRCETMPDWQWVILDGPVDTVWVESLNTVLDDTRTLCLANSERIRLPLGMRMIFEVDSLSQASPATVSRCAMVYMDPVDLGWQPFVKTWLVQLATKLPPRGVQYLESLLSMSVEEGLQFIRKHKAFLPFPLQDVGVVMNLCKILQAFMDFMSVNGGFGQINEDITEEYSVSPFPGGARQLSSANTVYTPSLSGSLKRREEHKWFMENHPEKLTSLLGKIFVFAFTWAFGGALQREDEQEGDSLIGLKARDESLVNVTYDFSSFVHDLFEGENNYGIQMPLGEKSMFSYFVDLQTGNFVPWSNLIPSTESLIRKGTLSFSDSKGVSRQHFISTVDSIKYSFLASLLLVSNQPLLITGDSGVGKSTLIQDLLRKLQEPGGLSVNTGTILGDIFLFNESRKISLLQNITSLTNISGTENYSALAPNDLASGQKSHRTNQLIVSTVQLGANTSTATVQGQILNKLTKRGRDTLGAPKSKKVAVFIDDLNMPNPEQYGAQPPLELIRQFLELGGFYDTNTLNWKNVQDVSLIAACAPPGGGRNEISPRLLQHFCMIVLPHPSVQALQHIFQVQLGTFLQSNNFLAEIQKCRNLLSSCSIAIYYKMCQSLLPTPAKCHYTFNLRDLFKVLQGLLQANGSVIVTKENAAQLLSHEVTRVFHDRLVEDRDREIFYQCLSDELHNYFKFSWTKEKLMKEPIQFADFLEPNTSVKTRIYRPVTNRKLLVSRLEDYRIKMKINSSNATGVCVFFKDAIQHILRAARVFRQPGGHLMLIGLDGMGKVTNAAMACYISECKLFRLSITQNYSHAEFREELKKVYKQAGLQGTNTVLLITDTDLVKDSFLEDINCILSSGEVPELFDKEELDGIFVELKAAALETNVADNPQSFLAFFLQRVRCKLHVVLALSPAGQTFRERCRLNPSLVNCCTIDWYDEWPEEALLDVAIGHITQHNLVQDRTELQNNIAKVCVEIHKSVSRKVTQFLGETRQHYYITPQNYLGFIDTFSHIFQTRKELITMDRNRFFTGLSKLLEAASSVEIMQQELVVLGPQIEKKSKEIEVLMVKLQKDSVVVEQVRTIVKQEEEVMAEETNIVEKYAENAFQELSDVLPALQQAVSALDSLDKSDISEVRVYTHPPFLVLTVMNAVCVLLQKKPDWPTAKLLLGDPGFLKRLVTLDKDSIPDKVFVKLRQYSQVPEFNPKVVGFVSNACRSLCQWVLALEHYHNVQKTVEPKQRRLSEAKEALRLAQERLKQKQKALSAVEEHQQSLQRQYNESVAAKDLLAHRKQLTAVRLKTASVLIFALDEEKVRWQESVNRLDLRLEGILGNLLVSAAFIVYCGVFTSDYRTQLVGEWLKLCETYKIPASDDYSVIRAMASKNEVRRWQNEGLPPDPYSTENAILVKNGQRWPLLIDPHGQAYKWICQMEGERLQKVRASDPGYITIMENAIRLGEPVLLQDVAEDLDPSLKPILGKKIYRRAGQDFIKIGDSEIEYNHNFRLYMTTPSPNPHFLPAVCIMVTMINFTVTFKGLRDQLLSLVVEHKQPHLEEQRSQLMESITEDLYTLHELEEKSLTLLQKTEGHLLDDHDLIETLKKSKITSRNVSQRIEASEKTEATIEAAREVYLPIATRGAILYFMVADLIHLNYMYQFSLHWFHQVFVESLGSVETIQPELSFSGTIRPSSRAKSANKVVQESPSIESEDIKRQIHDISNVLTENVYKIISSGLFTEHQLCCSFMLCANIMKHSSSSDPSSNAQELLPNPEWDFFLHSMLLANMMEKETHPNIIDRQVPGQAPTTDSNAQTEEVGGESHVHCSPKCLSESTWKQCQYLTANMKSFSSLCHTIASNTQQWKEFFKADDLYQYLRNPYTLQPDITLPIEETPANLEIFQWEKLSSFQKLIMIKVLRPECFISAIQDFIVENMGLQYLQSGRMNLKQVYEKSTATEPLIFILSPGTDPVGQLERLAMETRGSTMHLDIISLGRGQGVKAEELISKAQHLKGRWVFLQNCHLAASFMPKLQEIVAKLSHQNNYTDSQFRLWLSSKPDTAFPVSILQKSFKMAVEPPQGLKGKLLQTFDASGSGVVTEDVFEKGADGQSWKKLLFSLCFFNAVINERRKYGSLGWNIPYQFTASDLEVSIQMLAMFMQGQNEIPWQAVHYLTGEVVYGGRVTDSWDRRCLLSILDNFYNPAVLQENHSFSSDNVYRSLSDSATLQDYRDYLSSLPDTDSPEIFGMHPTAERTHLESQAQIFLDTIVSMQSRISVEHAADRGEENKDKIVLEIIADILKVLPQTVETKTKQDPAVNVDGVTLSALFALPAWESVVKSTQGYDPLINSALLTVLHQEIDRFNHLLSVIHTSLHSLKQAIRGEIILNKALEDVYNSLMNLKVPPLWQQCSYESCKLLGSWVDDLVQRLDFFSTWAKHVMKCIQERFGQVLGFQKVFQYHRPSSLKTALIPEITAALREQPNSYWLSAFFFPQGFLTAVLQNFARMKGLSVDSLTFKHRVLPAASDTTEGNRRQNVIGTAFSESSLPEEGILIFGLFLDGAKWDIKTQALQESEHQHRFYSMPQIQFIPRVNGVGIEDEASDEEMPYTYECPLYRTPKRAGTLSSTGLSTNYVTAVTLQSCVEPKHWIRRGVALLCQMND
ncbi:dynein axonemal heavy chain 14 [Pelobates fuscus]|uniref:dynein axonemal heavy chain 14 n=1 Tax=Pelobates fuscus TaxID=191477 RepID=UPI002FE4DD01